MSFGVAGRYQYFTGNRCLHFHCYSTLKLDVAAVGSEIAYFSVRMCVQHWKLFFLFLLLGTINSKFLYLLLDLQILHRFNFVFVGKKILYCNLQTHIRFIYFGTCIFV